ncbi:MAG TPA: dihydropteroate synthase [Candidatus Binataceae bacterium]|nr:dihydropteroate synthase [Candidatus Binataceae bacterium]
MRPDSHSPRKQVKTHPDAVGRRPPELPAKMRLRDGRVLRFPAVMGVLNVTPDSFSDGGKYFDPARAVEHALEMEGQGADIIDIGGESSRPGGAVSIAPFEELRRIIPVIKALAGKLKIPISIDTRKAAVAAPALAAGAVMINDVSAMEHDPAMAAVAARARAAIVLMHMRGGVEDHVKFARYSDVAREVIDYLAARAAAAIGAGIAPSRIIVDPGIGFAKTARHNLALLDALPRLAAVGYPVLVGSSRKSFIGRIAGDSERAIEFGTAAADALAVAAGASIVRVHDPGAARAVVRMVVAIRGSSPR